MRNFFRPARRKLGIVFLLLFALPNFGTTTTTLPDGTVKKEWLVQIGVPLAPWFVYGQTHAEKTFPADSPQFKSGPGSLNLKTADGTAANVHYTQVTDSRRFEV